MCLNDDYFLLVHNDQKMILEDVASLLVMNGKVRLVDVFGKHRDIDATIQEVDIRNKPDRSGLNQNFSFLNLNHR